MTTESQIFKRKECERLYFYYEPIQVNVNTTGFYIFSTTASMSTYGYLYQHYFNPYYLSDNLLLNDSGRCYGTQFKLVGYLQSNVTYILVVTTYSPEMKVNILIAATGENSVVFKRISKYSRFINNQHKNKKI